jgi:hypothetical protein
VFCINIALLLGVGARILAMFQQQLQSGPSSEPPWMKTFEMKRRPNLADQLLEY